MRRELKFIGDQVNLFQDGEVINVSVTEFLLWGDTPFSQAGRLVLWMSCHWCGSSDGALPAADGGTQTLSFSRNQRLIVGISNDSPDPWTTFCNPGFAVF